MPRPLSAIAREVYQVWPKPHFSAVPYLRAMAQLNSVSDHYGYDPGTSIVRRFLGNARTWKGPDARRIKSELKGLLK